MKYSKEVINNILHDLGKNHIMALSGVDNVKEKVELYCTLHKCRFNQTLDDIKHKKYSCPECAKIGRRKTNLSKHNLLIDRPDVANLLKDKDKASSIHTYTKEKEWFICPHCGTPLFKSVFNVVQNGLHCNLCSDGFSYPNKLMFNILLGLNIEFEPEFKPDWIKHSRYDFMFVKDNKKYIIEMDGGLGHGKKSFGSKEDLSKSLNKDLYKDKKAKENGFRLIRINSDFSDVFYIKEQIIKSELSKIFDLNNVDWDRCDLLSRSSILLEVCNYYNSYKCSYNDLHNKFQISKDTVKKYLKIGYTLGLNPKYEAHYNGKSIICIESQIIFSSASQASKFYGLDKSLIRRVCLGERNTVGDLHFVYLDNYDGNIETLKPNYTVVADINKNKKHQIPIIIIDLFENKTYSFDSIGLGAKFLNKHDSIIGKCVDRGTPYLGRYFIISDSAERTRNIVDEN